MALTLTSSAFADGGAIPRRYTCDGEDLSPPLAWSGVPDRARSLFLVCEDPDAPRGVFRHWAAFDMPPDSAGLGEGVAPGGRGGAIRQAINDFGKPGYGGPCPPRGDRPHHYHFRLSALDAVLDAAPSAIKIADLIRLSQPHVLATAELIGVYGRGG